MISTMFWLSWPLHTDGQVQLVFDSASWIETINIVSQTVELVQSAAAQLKMFGDMKAITEVADQTAVLINELQGIITEMDAVNRAWDVLTGPPEFPNTASALAQWNQRAAALQSRSIATGNKAQVLLKGTIAALNLLLRLTLAIAGIAGSKAGLQEITAVMAKVDASLARMQGMIASYQQVKLGSEQIKTVNAQARYNLAQARLRCFGSIKPCL